MPGEILALSMLVGGGIAGASAFITSKLSQRTRSLKRVEKELEKASALVERGLINQEEYQSLKARLLDGYRPGYASAYPVRQVAKWTGLAGVSTALLMFALEGPALAAEMIIGWAFLLAAATVGGTLVGGATYTYKALLRREGNPLLDEGQKFRRLGE
jgi:hypothetical protein